jgi:hypothetical protein
LSYARIRPALVLAVGECLAVSAAIEYEELEVPGEVEKAVLNLYTYGDSRVLEELSLEDKILVYTIAYGGLILSYTCDPVTPISRAHVTIGIEIVGRGGAPSKVNDRRILEAWALLYQGREEEGLSRIKGASYYPKQLEWRPGGKIRILPVAVSLALNNIS